MKTKIEKQSQKNSRLHCDYAINTTATLPHSPELYAMPKPEEDLIDRLTLRPEVREKARALLRAAHSKTGPGTGYDIGDAKSGLPAICTYIASKRYTYKSLSTRFLSRELIIWNVLVPAMQTSPKKSPRRHHALHPRRFPAR